MSKPKPACLPDSALRRAIESLAASIGDPGAKLQFIQRTIDVFDAQPELLRKASSLKPFAVRLACFGAYEEAQSGTTPDFDHRAARAQLGSLSGASRHSGGPDCDTGLSSLCLRTSRLPRRAGGRGYGGGAPANILDGSLFHHPGRRQGSGRDTSRLSPRESGRAPRTSVAGRRRPPGRALEQRTTRPDEPPRNDATSCSPGMAATPSW